MTINPRRLALGSKSLLSLLFLLAACHHGSGARTTVKGYMQARPGGPMERVKVGVHKVPVDPPSKAAAESELGDDELVLGVVVADQAMAYPIRFVAMHEVVDDRVLDTPLAATW